LRNIEKAKAAKRRWAARNREKERERAKRNYQLRKDRHAVLMKRHREENQEWYTEWWKQYRKTHKKVLKARSKLSKVKRLQRVPSWADNEALAQVYKDCPEGYHVDHIVPLQGKIVSGLHVEYNLQYLTPKENLAKSNKFPYGDYF